MVDFNWQFLRDFLRLEAQTTVHHPEGTASRDTPASAAAPDESGA